MHQFLPFSCRSYYSFPFTSVSLLSIFWFSLFTALHCSFSFRASHIASLASSHHCYRLMEVTSGLSRIQIHSPLTICHHLVDFPAQKSLRFSYPTSISFPCSCQRMSRPLTITNAYSFLTGRGQRMKSLSFHLISSGSAEVPDLAPYYRLGGKALLLPS